MLPWTVAVPVLMANSVILLAAAPSEKFRLPPMLKVPAPTFTSLVVLLVVLITLTSFVTVNVLAPPMVSEELSVPSATVTKSATAAVSTVTVSPAEMTTSSLTVGTYPQDQVAAELHNPVLVEVQTAADRWKLETLPPSKS